MRLIELIFIKKIVGKTDNGLPAGGGLSDFSSVPFVKK